MIQHPLPFNRRCSVLAKVGMNLFYLLCTLHLYARRRTLLALSGSLYILERQHVSKPYPPYSSIKLGLLFGLLRNESLPGSRVLDLEAPPESLKKKDTEGREERPGRSCSLYQSLSQHKFYFITSLYNIYSLTLSII